MFARIGVTHPAYDDYDAITGVIVGAATLNEPLLSGCLLELLHQTGFTKLAYSGLIGLTLQNPSLEKELTYLAKVVGIDSPTALSLMRLRTHDSTLLEDAVVRLAS